MTVAACQSSSQKPPDPRSSGVNTRRNESGPGLEGKAEEELFWTRLHGQGRKELEALSVVFHCRRWFWTATKGMIQPRMPSHPSSEHTKREKEDVMERGGKTEGLIICRSDDWLLLCSWLNKHTVPRSEIFDRAVRFVLVGPKFMWIPPPHPCPPLPTHNQQRAVLQGSGGNQEGSAGHLNEGLWENECQRQGESDRKQTLAWDSTSALQRPSSEADWNQPQRGVFQRPLRRGLFSERVCQDGRWQMGEGGAGTFLSSANYLFTSWFHWGPTEENNTYI